MGTKFFGFLFAFVLLAVPSAAFACSFAFYGEGRGFIVDCSSGVCVEGRRVQYETAARFLDFEQADWQAVNTLLSVNAVVETVYLLKIDAACYEALSLDPTLGCESNQYELRRQSGSFDTVMAELSREQLRRSVDDFIAVTLPFLLFTVIPIVLLLVWRGRLDTHIYLLLTIFVLRLLVVSVFLLAPCTFIDLGGTLVIIAIFLLDGAAFWYRHRRLSRKRNAVLLEAYRSRLSEQD